jgi:hypothetical protein
MSSPIDPDHHSFEFQAPGGFRLSAKGLGLVVAALAVVGWIVLHMHS